MSNSGGIGSWMDCEAQSIPPVPSPGCCFFHHDLLRISSKYLASCCSHQYVLENLWVSLLSTSDSAVEKDVRLAESGSIKIALAFDVIQEWVISEVISAQFNYVAVHSGDVCQLISCIAYIFPVVRFSGAMQSGARTKH
ncbi:hypothetical protein M0802_007894 [Mischocyttarus mexicanus]|nr:hypothetical protein M0802_007894 [Mischocyttarus mexicanus]